MVDPVSGGAGSTRRALIRSSGGGLATGAVLSLSACGGSSRRPDVRTIPAPVRDVDVQILNDLLDRKIFVTNSDAIVFTRKLLDEEGLFTGVSSGAIARVAVRIASELDEGNVVFVVADDGWKYLSSGVYTRPIEEIENLDATVWW